MTTDAVRITHAVKQFGKVSALRDVSLSLHNAEWLGLLGPNGAGKSTLIRAISGRIRLTSGTVDIIGVGQRGAPDVLSRRAAIGLVPQSVALFPLLTSRENLQIFGGTCGLRGSQLSERIQWALQWSGLEERADQQVRTYSGGMKRRLNIACGVLHRPSVILLDEPTVGVDPQSRQRIFEMLHELHQDGAALIHATNQLEDAEQFCERIVILDRGAVIADGKLDDLIARTVGKAHRIVITVSEPPSPSKVPAGFSANGPRISGTLDDIASDLQNLLSWLRHANVDVVDLYVEAPRLQTVFLQLTGRELRD